jgi:hypothetical protein
LQRSLQPSATGSWLLQLLQHCVGHPGRHNAYLQASAVTRLLGMSKTKVKSICSLRDHSSTVLADSIEG